MPDALSELHLLYSRRHELCRTGEGQIGTVTKSVPIELIIAAGLRPTQIFGDPSRSTTRGDRYMESEVDGEVRSVFDRLLCGDGAHLPMIVLPRVSEQHLQLYYYLQEVRSWEPGADIPPVILFDCMQTSYWATGRYVRARLDEVRSRIEQFGRPIDEADLRNAIGIVNAMRASLNDLNALRRQGRFNGSDFFRTAALFGTLVPGEFIRLCNDLEKCAAPVSGGPRVMLSGSAQDSPMVYEIIEALGARVVADDHVNGERIASHLVDETLDPMDSLAEHYQLHAPGVRQFPQRRQDDRFLAICRDAQVDLDICVLEDVDDTLGWDWPKRRDKLAALGIRSILVTGQDYFDPGSAQIADAIGSALEENQKVSS